MCPVFFLNLSLAVRRSIFPSYLIYINPFIMDNTFVQDFKTNNYEKEFINN
jgi:hypothetical protein